MRWALGLGIVLFAGAASAAEDPLDAAARAADRGAMIFHYDQAAWITSDELEKEPTAERSQIRGWVVEPDGRRLKVTYYGLEDENPVAVHIYTVEADKVVEGHAVASEEERALSSLGLRMVRATAAALALPDRPVCSEARPNPVALPPQAPGDPLPVYLLTPQEKTGEYPMGGHFLAEFAPDGRMVSSRKFANACNVLTTAPPEGGRPAAMVVTHALDLHPTEIHVFTSLSAELPLYVATRPGRTLWRVIGGDIKRMEGAAD